jgi:outer membrane protein OmpA-like peptidoglycan-associated protein
VRESNRQLTDNLELSAPRALTVTRALIDEGLPSSAIFAAAVGPEQPVASKADPEGRSRNRRVEMAPVPKSGKESTAGSTPPNG